MPKSSVPAHQPVPRQRLAECVAKQLRSDLLRIRPHPDHIAPMVMYRLWATLDAFPQPFGFRFFNGADRESAFNADPATGTIEFNLAPIYGVYRRAVGLALDKKTRREAVRAALEEFLIHEIYHGVQKLLVYEHVRMISKMTSPLQIGILDLFADIFSASCCAELDCYRQNNFTEYFYFSRLLVHLTLMLDLWVPQVKAPADKQHKRLRFAGVAFTAALVRAALRLRLIGKPLTVNTPLLPLLERQDRCFAIETELGCHSFRATGITVYLKNGGLLEHAQQMAAHESARTTKLYDRRNDKVTLDEVEKITL